MKVLLLTLLLVTACASDQGNFKYSEPKEMPELKSDIEPPPPEIMKDTKPVKPVAKKVVDKKKLVKKKIAKKLPAKAKPKPTPLPDDKEGDFNQLLDK